MENYMKFDVQGNEGQYVCEFTRIGDKIKATCTCEAGLHGMHCRHRIMLMSGDCSIIISKNKSEITKLTGMIEGTEVQNALLDVLQTQKHLQALEEDFARKKKKLARLMTE